MFEPIETVEAIVESCTETVQGEEYLIVAWDTLWDRRHEFYYHKPLKSGEKVTIYLDECE